MTDAAAPAALNRRDMHAADGPSPWLRVRSERPAASLRLICLHHAGGGALGFRGWEEWLPAEVELAAVQLPGRETRLSEPPLDRVEDVLDGILEAMGADPRPYALFGHSLGAGLAYRLSRRVEQTQELPSPRHVFVSAAQPPAWTLRGRREKPGEARPLGDDDLVAELARLGGTPAAFLREPALLAPFLPALRADFMLASRLVLDAPEPIHAPLTVFGGAQDATVSAMDLEQWRHLSSHSMALRMFPGGHFYLQAQMRSVVAAVTETLAPLLEPDEPWAEGVIA